MSELVQITKEQLQEYELLKTIVGNEKKNKVYESLRSIEYLEDDIDFPIKKTVALFALLGCQPVFSCCGYDYEGQPLHKKHQYDNPYFMFMKNNRSLWFVDWYVEGRDKLGWDNRWWFQDHGQMFFMQMGRIGTHWDNNKECIHFSEQHTISIARLEKKLLTLKDEFLEEILLEDMNVINSRVSEYWQYKPKKPWLIRKSDYAK